MKINSINDINEKIALLECIKEVVNSCEGRRDCYASYNDEGQPIPPTDNSTPYERDRYNAYQKIINELLSIF